MFIPHRKSFLSALSICSLICLLSMWASIPAAAQTEEEQFTPTYVTARIFQARAPKSRKADISDQLFQLKNQESDEKWISQIQKAYPNFEISILQTHQLRVFKSPKPGVIYLGKRGAPHVEVQIFGAFGEGEEGKVGTTIITSVEYHNPNTRTPMAMAYQGTPVTVGKTYFFTHRSLNLKKADYVEYLRPGSNPATFENDDIYLIVALSVEADKHAPATFDAKSSAELQESATKKIEPQWPEELKKSGLSGKVQVRVELNDQGKVTQASIFSSTLPEANVQALAAARQWEFPTATLTGKATPATAILTFNSAATPQKAQTTEPTKSATNTNR